MCTEKWIPDPGTDPRKDKGHYETTDCRRCSCGSSSARHSPATEEKTGMRYCTVCDEYIR